MLRAFEDIIRTPNFKASQAYHLSMLYRGVGNSRVDCTTLPRIDLTLWRDQPQPSTYRQPRQQAHAAVGTVQLSRTPKYNPIRQIYRNFNYRAYGRPSQRYYFNNNRLPNRYGGRYAMRYFRK
ncbi:uncharacterized protein LOC106160650 [Lingula anatina]|nr:uncharacterized protein LOC106160650 [Lingula anatina]|eukprot:XP_013392758.1 uncharacterized protein LOC106160650 [Lingula anatina]